MVGPDADPAILVGNECFGMAGAAPLPMRRHLYQDLSLPNQPRERSGSLAEILGDEGVVPGARVGVIGWKPYADPTWLDAPSYLVDQIRGLVGPGGSVVNVAGHAHRPGARPADHQRGGPDRGLRIRVLPDVGRRPAVAVRPSPGHDGAGGCGSAGLERRTAVLPSHADGRSTSHPGPAQPLGPTHRAGRPVHDRVRHLGRPDLPGGVRDRGRGWPARWHRRLRRATRGAVLRGRGRVVPGTSHRAPGRGAPGDHRSPPG